MKFNIKVILLGGLALYAAQWVVSMVSGAIIHEGILTEMYQAHASFWRPELNQQPPDMAALMPRWMIFFGARPGLFLDSISPPSMEIDGGEDCTGRSQLHTVGFTFAFKRNRLVGSYLFFTLSKRAKLPW
jgi:hypothetical protein